jgi:tetratricopeptide (TPR) repeat protein
MLRSLLFAMALACPLVAHAQPRTPSAADKQAAVQHWEKARSAYSFGNYDIAIAEYQAAFDLTGAPEYVFNIAQTQRAKGDKPAAVASYKRYLELDPSGDGAASARQHVEALEAELNRDLEATAARARAQAEAEAKRKHEAAAAAEAARRDAAEVARKRVADAEIARRRTTARTVRLAGLATAGAGVVTLGASAYFGMRARSLSNDASAVSGQWTEAAQQTVDDARSAERMMYVLLAVGGGVAITGGILYAVGARSIEAPTRVGVIPTRGGAAVSLTRRF